MAPILNMYRFSSKRRGTWPGPCQMKIVPEGSVEMSVVRAHSADSVQPQAWETESSYKEEQMDAEGCRALPRTRTRASEASVASRSCANAEDLESCKSRTTLRSKETGMTKLQAAVTMANVFIGLSMLSLPYGMGQAGGILGLCILLGVVCLMGYTAILVGDAFTASLPILEKLGMSVDDVDFSSVALAASGEKGCYIMAAAVFVELWMGVVAYVILQASNFQILFGLGVVEGATICTLCSFALLDIPPEALSFISSVSVAATFVAVMALVATAAAVLDIGLPDFDTYHGAFRPSGAITMLGISLFGFAGHPELGYVYTSMRDPAKDYRGAVKLAVLFAGLFYAFISVVGYIFLGDFALKVFTENIGKDLDYSEIPGLAWMAKVAAAALAVKIQGTVPLSLAPAALMLQRPFARDEEPEDGKSRYNKCVLIVLALLTGATASALGAYIAVVTSLIGNVLTMVTSVVFPAFAACILVGADRSRWETSLMRVIAVSGLIVAVSSLVLEL
eukprot:TRINITY_DN7733_c0_g1_i1.p1 TRINITY_DN7733_c0_g1~~TRINITY_DN7733_c0_g1_i1.p1  ORF type:complete len:507 (-),score=98.59 TRINITY_DN7733_c0_g1_i1:367-1887(-)